MECRQGPVPVTEESNALVKVDTVFFGNGNWMTGSGLYFIEQTPRAVIPWGYVVAIGGLLILLLVSLGFLWHRRHRIIALQSQIEQIRSEITRQENLLLSRNDSERILALLNEKVTMVKKLLEKHDQMKLRQGLSYLDELESLQETVKGYHAYLEELKEDASFLGDLESALNAGKNGIMRKLRDAFGDRMTQTDYEILSYYFSGMDTSSISFITGIKPGTLRTRKSRCKDRIRSLPDSPERVLFLKEIEKRPM